LKVVHPTIIFTEDEVTLRYHLPGGVPAIELRGIYHLTETRRPKQIDLTTLSGLVRKTWVGIYEFVDEDTVRMCLRLEPATARERPTAFGTVPGVLQGVSRPGVSPWTSHSGSAAGLRGVESLFR
jgi:uncharacterized protein (TIGR03067 family)